MIERAGEFDFKPHPHMLRHACGFALASKGHDTRALQAYLGHRNIQHTVRYTELSPGRRGSKASIDPAKIKQMKADGLDVVGFGAGEPDFDTPQHIKDAAAKALAEGFTKYTPASGIPELKKAIAKTYQERTKLEYAPGQVVVSNGAKHSLHNVFAVLCNPGDEVVIPAPFWVSYAELVKLTGATPKIIATPEANQFKLTPAQLRAAIQGCHRREPAGLPPPRADRYRPAPAREPDQGDRRGEPRGRLRGPELFPPPLPALRGHRCPAASGARLFARD
jgi:hypothetical protein